MPPFDKRPRLPRRALTPWVLGGWCTIVLSALTELSCASHDCTAMGCGPPQVGASITLPISSASPVEGQVEVCVGTGSAPSCGTRTVRWDMVSAAIQKSAMAGPTVPRSFANQFCSAPDGAAMEIDCTAATEGPLLSEAILRVDVVLSVSDPRLEGAPLTMVLTADDGSVLAEAAGTIHLGKGENVNGAECGPPCGYTWLSDTQATGLPVTFSNF